MSERRLRNRFILSRAKSAVLLGALLFFCFPVELRGRAQQEGQDVPTKVGELLSAGNLTKAEKISSAFLSEHSKDPEAFLKIGRIHFEHEQWERAASLLRKSLELQNRNDVAHLLLGLSLEAMNQSSEAERELQLAVEQNPRSDTNWFMAGRHLLLEGKYEASLAYFYKAIELSPENPRGYQALASALARTGSYGLAETYYKKAIAIVEKQRLQVIEPYLDLSYLLLLSEKKETATSALEYTRKALAMTPRSAEGRYLCGKALLKLERHAEARAELAEAAKLNPQDARPYFLLAQIYDRLGDHARAREARKTFARLNNRRVDEAPPAVETRP